MSKVKMSFSIEVDDNILIKHSIEQEQVTSFHKDREFAEEVINKLNTFYTGLNIYHQDWEDLKRSKKMYQEHLQQKQENEIV
ncbi:hypothetical protein SAMN05660772_02053 [Pasteurella testudinis DSM 23072]|uniref:Uncharacterized protein n=1 Tax=Pasteurella testudinis DSM 23072 TaxID=1122938 RepID=A0A1W1UMV6_9PAST|nr:hypothetical protein [Pasteurella testudinis]SMB82319.1 hypothetical protein SAMN05660772_02053 [Pasteurella testudinis DSM 23072]SUB51491.1 Uncharacterised protein [Pasteurella testudinis]